MKMWIHFLAVASALVLLFASLGHAAMLIAQAEGEQAVDLAAQVPSPVVTGPQEQGPAQTNGEQAVDLAAQAPPPDVVSTPEQGPASTAGEQNTAAPVPEQEEAAPAATAAPSSSPVAEEQNAPAVQGKEEAVPAATTLPSPAPSVSEQNAATPAPGQKEAVPSAATPSSSPVAGEQNAPAAVKGQEEAVPAATTLPSPAQTVGEQNTATSAPGQKEAVPAAVTPTTSSPAQVEQHISAPAGNQQQPAPSGLGASPAPAAPAASEQKAPAPAAAPQATTPAAVTPTAGTQGGTPTTGESPAAYPSMGAQQPVSTPTGEQRAGGLSLKESIAIALQKSPTVQSAQSAIQGAEYQRRAAVSDFLPQVTMGYSYTRLDKPPFFVTPPIFIPPPLGPATIPASRSVAGTVDNYNWSTSVSQPVFTGGALINSYLLAKIGVDSAKVTLEQTRLDLVLQVKVAYYAVLTGEKGVEIGQQSVADFESHYTVAKAFFEVGITAKNDVLQVEVQLAQARQNLIAAEHGLEVARAVFNTLLRRDINEPVRLGETLEYNPLTMNMNALYNEALRQRPEIRLSDLGIDSAKKEVGIAASKLFPQLSLVYTYERLGDDPTVDGSHFTHMHDWNIQAVAQWNVWDWGKAWWGVEQSKANVFQAQCALEQVKDSVKLDVQAAALKVTEASKNLQVAETAVGQAEEDARINEEKFKGQVATTTDVLDSLTRLTQARINYYSALSDYNIARARLQRSIGSQ